MLNSIHIQKKNSDWNIVEQQYVNESDSVDDVSLAGIIKSRQLYTMFVGLKPFDDDLILNIILLLSALKNALYVIFKNTLF